MIGNSSLFAIRKPIFINQITNVTIDTLNVYLLWLLCERKMLLQFIQLNNGRFPIKPTTCYISFCSFFLLNHALTWLFLRGVMRKSWLCPFSLCFSSSESHVHSSELNNIHTILILSFSCTFILMSWIHVACFNGPLKIGIAWCKTFISSYWFKSFLIVLNKFSAMCTKDVSMPCFSAIVMTVRLYLGFVSPLMNRWIWCKNSSHGLNHSSAV